jgi:hypothetical protein
VWSETASINLMLTRENDIDVHALHRQGWARMAFADIELARQSLIKDTAAQAESASSNSGAYDRVLTAWRTDG